MTWAHGITFEIVIMYIILLLLTIKTIDGDAENRIMATTSPTITNVSNTTDFMLTSAVTNEPLKTSSPEQLVMNRKLNKIYNAILGGLMFGGTVCNCLSFIILLHNNMRQCPVSVYLISLSISDTCYLWWDNSYHWFKDVTGKPLPGLTISCNWRMSGDFTFSYISGFIIVAVTAERLIAVWFPMKIKSHNVRYRSCLVVVFILVSMCGINIPTYLMFEGAGCDVKPEYLEFASHFFYVIVLLLANFIPDGCIILFNSLIYVGIKRSTKHLKDSHRHVGQFSETESTKSNKLTKMIMTLALTRLCLTLPFLSVDSYVYFSGLFTQQGSLGINFNITYGLLFLFYVSNFAVNLFLHSATSKNFRYTFKLICCCKLKTET